MFLISVLRHHAGKLMRTDAKVDAKALREGQAVLRSQRFRAGAAFLPASALRARVEYFCEKEARHGGALAGGCAQPHALSPLLVSQTGVFQQKVEKLTPQQQMLSDPSAMTGMMKNSLGPMVHQMATSAQRCDQQHTPP